MVSTIADEVLSGHRSEQRSVTSLDGSKLVTMPGLQVVLQGCGNGSIRLHWGLTGCLSCVQHYIAPDQRASGHSTGTTKRPRDSRQPLCGACSYELKRALLPRTERDHEYVSMHGMQPSSTGSHERGRKHVGAGMRDSLTSPSHTNVVDISETRRQSPAAEERCARICGGRRRPTTQYSGGVRVCLHIGTLPPEQTSLDIEVLLFAIYASDIIIESFPYQNLFSVASGFTICNFAERSQNRNLGRSAEQAPSLQASFCVLPEQSGCQGPCDDEREYTGALFVTVPRAKYIVFAEKEVLPWRRGRWSVEIGQWWACSIACSPGDDASPAGFPSSIDGCVEWGESRCSGRVWHVKVDRCLGANLER